MPDEMDKRRAMEAAAARNYRAALAAEKKVRDLKKHLMDLTIAVGSFLILLDREMRTPSDAQRGRRIGILSNELEMYNDRARYFGLGIDYRKDLKGAEIKPAPSTKNIRGGKQ